jgi:hypothetical protein
MDEIFVVQDKVALLSLGDCPGSREIFGLFQSLYHSIPSHVDFSILIHESI